MLTYLITSFVYALVCRSVQADIDSKFGPRFGDADANLDVPQIIAKYGYPAETHEITTEDGYILILHRISAGKNENPPAPNKPVVWLQHGMLMDSASWIMNSEKNALGYALADAGYDVWMGNSRGNRYSNRHVNLVPDEEQFWNFSFHEIGVYDLPAGIDYALQTTGQSDLIYFGHSEGSTAFFVCVTEHPEFNAKIRLMFALAPIAYTEYIESHLNSLASIANNTADIRNLLGAKNFVPDAIAKEFLGAGICRKANDTNIELCSNVLFLFGGYQSFQFDQQLITGAFGHVPSGTSVKNVIHFAQGITSTGFGQFNYGAEKNLEIYGQTYPPAYDMTKFNCPIAIFWAESDWLASNEDVYRITEELSTKLVLKYRINDLSYNHLDFIWAIDNDNLLIRQILALMEFFLP